MKVSFTLFATPRTKKNSGTIAGFGKPCRSCGRPPYSKLVPSKQYTEFAKLCLLQAAQLRSAIEKAGLQLPITKPVSIAAKFYRDADAGDWNGYTDALADVLQQPTYSVPCPAPECRTPKGSKTRVTVTWDQIQRTAAVECGRCGTKFEALGFGAKTEREGLGIIADDRLVNDWDGTRRLIDRVRPRIEVTISVLEQGLFDGANQ